MPDDVTRMLDDLQKLDKEWAVKSKEIAKRGQEKVDSVTPRPLGWTVHQGEFFRL